MFFARYVLSTLDPKTNNLPQLKSIVFQLKGHLANVTFSYFSEVFCSSIRKRGFLSTTNSSTSYSLEFWIRRRVHCQGRNPKAPRCSDEYQGKYTSLCPFCTRWSPHLCGRNGRLCVSLLEFRFIQKLLSRYSIESTFLCVCFFHFRKQCSVFPILLWNFGDFFHQKVRFHNHKLILFYVVWIIPQIVPSSESLTHFISQLTPCCSGECSTLCIGSSHCHLSSLWRPSWI